MLLTNMVDKYAKILWGEKVGKEFYCKTPAQALVQRLWYISVNLKNSKSEKEKTELKEREVNFLSTFEDALLPDENGDEILIEALEYGKKKEEVTARLVMPENLISKTTDVPVAINCGDYLEVYKIISDMISSQLESRHIIEQDGM